jgi:hypothetical protein
MVPWNIRSPHPAALYRIPASFESSLTLLWEPQISRHIDVRAAETSGMQMSKFSVNLTINNLEVEKQRSVGRGEERNTVHVKTKFFRV